MSTPKVRLLDGRPEPIPGAVVITAYRVVDGGNRTVAHETRREDAERTCRELQAKHPDRTFYVI